PVPSPPTRRPRNDGPVRGRQTGPCRLTLTATGATSRIRRPLTSTTAGALALLGALLGVAGAYAALAALYRADLGYLTPPPLLYLVLVVVGMPPAAAARAGPPRAASRRPSPGR